MQYIAKTKGFENKTFHMIGISKELLKKKKKKIGFVVLRPLPHIEDIKGTRMEIRKGFIREMSLNRVVWGLHEYPFQPERDEE